MPVSVIWLWIDFHERTTTNISRCVSGIGGRCALDSARRRAPGDGVGATMRCDRPTHGSHLSRSATAPTADSDGRRLSSARVDDAVVLPATRPTAAYGVPRFNYILRES